MALFKFGRRTDPSRDASRLERRAPRVDPSPRPAEPALDQRRRARQRLIGATVLALAAVVGLPMLLESDPRPVPQDLPISIPSKDRATRPVTGTPRPAAADRRAESRADDKPALERVRDGSKPDIARVEPKPDSSATAARSESAPPVAGKPATVPSESARALALLEGREPTAAEGAARSSTRYAIQVGAYSSVDKARDVQGRLKGAGIAAYTERLKTDGGERIRVRAGPFASRQAAEATRAKIEARGLTGAALVAL